MSHSLKRFHIAALAGIIACVVVTIAVMCLLITQSSTPETPETTSPGLQRLYVALAFLALGGIVVISAWLYSVTIPTMRHDIYTLVRMFKDVRQGAVRVAYPIMLREFAAAH